jgi:hypothetical protein
VARVDKRHEAELAELRFHWDTAYMISLHRGVWIAARRDDGTALTASSASELWRKIRADYRARPVPRQ